MKKRIPKTLLCLIFFAMTLTSCGNNNPYADDPRYPIYQLALDSGFTGTYQDWLDSIKGEDGKNGETPHIGENGNWWIGDTDTGVPAKGSEGPQGEPGKDGNTPYIGENGNWWIGDVDTGVPATGKDGADGAPGSQGPIGPEGHQGEPGKDGVDGKDGTSMHTGHGAPSNLLGQVGDSYVDLDTWDFYVKFENGWVLEGNIKGNNGSDYERETHTITFDSNGGSAVETQYVLHGEKITKPANPVRLGYEFNCWTYQGEPWSFVGYTCTEDMILVADWTLSEYTATFVNYNGEILDYQTGLHYGDKVSYGGVTPIKPSYEVGIGYEFTGWDKELFVVDNMVFTAQFKTFESEYVINHPVTINFWHPFNSKYASVITNFIEEFEEVEPNITVNLVYQGSYDDIKRQIITGFSAGNYPDIGICYPDQVADYIDYGKAVRLDQDFINNESYGWTEEDLEDIIPNYLEEGASYTIPGTYSLPFAKSTEAMFYNADVLIGLDLSSVDATINGGNPLTHEYLNNLTWEELFDRLCPAIVAHNATLPVDEKYLHDDKQYHGVVGHDSDSNLFITLAEQYGYGYTAIDESTGTGKVLFDNEGMKSLMKTFNKAYQDGYFITKGSTWGNYMSSLFTQQNLLFYIGSTDGTEYNYTSNFETGVARIPAAKDGNRHVISQGPSLTILDHSDEARALASWLFCKFMLNKENATTWAIQSDYEPIRYSSYDTYEYKSYLDYLSNSSGSDALLARVHKYCRSIMDDLYNTCSFKGSSSCIMTVANLVRLCLVEKNLDEYIDKYFKDALHSCLMYL